MNRRACNMKFRTANGAAELERLKADHPAAHAFAETWAHVMDQMTLHDSSVATAEKAAYKTTRALVPQASTSDIAQAIVFLAEHWEYGHELINTFEGELS